jgi:hypothetical protein
MAQALEIAQRALDLEAAQGRKLLSFPRVDEQHIVWWRGGCRRRTRCRGSRSQCRSAPRVRLARVGAATFWRMNPTDHGPLNSLGRDRGRGLRRALRREGAG